MSSPFRYFRKHTKIFMAVAVVLLMFIFVLGSALDGGGSSPNGNSATGTVATWKGGSLNQGQLGTLVAHRLITDEFLRRIFAQGGGSTIYDLPRDIPLQGFLLNDQQRDSLEPLVIQTEVEADLAKQAGITVSDDLITDYIEKMALGNINAEQLDRVLASVGNGNPRTSEGIVMGTLRKLLASHFYTHMYADPAQVVLPQQRWQDWKQVNERISVQAAILPADKFLADVPEPTEDQLRALYNDFKEFEPGRRVDVGGRLLPSPDPGFAEPQRVRLQYLKGSVASLTERMMEKVTDADVAYYYEQQKDTDFLRMDVPMTPSTNDEESPAATEPASESPLDAAPSSEETSATEEPSAPAETPAESTPPTAEEAPSESAEPATESEPPAEGEETSNARRASPFRLASFQDAPAEEPTDEATPVEAEADAGAEEAADEPAGAEPTAADLTAATPPAANDKYEPLENVRDEIRRELAREMAAKELNRIMGESMAQLQTEFNQYGIAVIEATEAGKRAPKPPAKLANLQWLADKNGLQLEKTTPLTALEMIETPVGRAIGKTTREMTVTQAVFLFLKPFEPFMANELEGDAYIVMKTEDVPRRIPEFKEVRDQVAAAWKRREAAKLAEKKAQELATEIEKSNTPFDQFFFADRGYEVVKETALFSWLNYPAGRAGTGTLPSLSDIPELEGIGPDFMKAAFSLSDSDTVALLNFDHSAAYVIRLVRRQWSDDDLKKLFLEEAETWPGAVDMFYKHARDFSQAATADMETRANLQFDEKWQEERMKRLQRQ